MPEGFAYTPEPPYSAVIFTSRRNGNESRGCVAKVERAASGPEGRG
ncbi:MAG: hypothetical protein AB7O57_04415 [Hyphomicrobiaceae bacterium]